MTYNGHKNYETWVVSNWLNNDYVDYQYWMGAAKDILRADAEFPVEALTERLQNAAEASKPEGIGFYSDLIQAALNEVSWYDIAETFIESAKEELG